MTSGRLTARARCAERCSLTSVFRCSPAIPVLPCRSGAPLLTLTHAPQVAGQGMEGCGNFGIPVIDSTEDLVRIWYFPVAAEPSESSTITEERYSRIISCVGSMGWRACTHLATLWLNQTLAPAALPICSPPLLRCSFEAVN